MFDVVPPLRPFEKHPHVDKGVTLLRSSFVELIEFSRDFVFRDVGQAGQTKTEAALQGPAIFLARARSGLVLADRNVLSVLSARSCLAFMRACASEMVG